MGQLSVVVEAQGLDPTVVVLLELHLVLDHFHTSLEDALILDSLAHNDLAGASTGAL